LTDLYNIVMETVTEDAVVSAIDVLTYFVLSEEEKRRALWGIIWYH